MTSESSRPAIHLVIGAARSGKSRYAESVARESGLTKLYLATARVLDEEMAARVTRHKLDRGVGWFTVEEPIALAEAVASRAAPDRIILVDCLTLWLTNLMLEGEDIAGHVAALATALERARGPVVLVSNEVGGGIVPDNAMAREFRDLQGRLNQDMAALASHVTLVVAGIPLAIKGSVD
jgi:adenosylcobinamide kinase/adenosylcobinamide-phosphate guanylyltransferase